MLVLCWTTVQIRAQKSADKTLIYLFLRSSTTYLPNTWVKPPPVGVSVHALLLGDFESVEVSKTRFSLTLFQYVQDARIKCVSLFHRQVVLKFASQNYYKLSKKHNQWYKIIYYLPKNEKTDSILNFNMALNGWILLHFSD